MTEAAPIAVSSQQGVGIIELARPEKWNCLSVEMLTAIHSALLDFEAPRSDVRAVLIRARGANFCTGADLAEVKAARQDTAELAAFTKLGHDVFARIEASALPVAAAVQGLCLAGGMELMLACDVVFAARDARIGDQHAQFGLVPGWGGSQRMPRIVGMRRALELMFSARWLDAETALQWGLVNRVCEPGDLQAAALEFCGTLATRSRAGIAGMKRLAREGLQLPIGEALAFEDRLANSILRGADVDEGIAAFEQRRTPRFGA